MANLVEIYLLDNKMSYAMWNGDYIDYESSYKIIAGELNATKFTLASVPAMYAECEFTITGYNAGKKVVQFDPVNKGGEFGLPIGMAIAGYSSLVLECTKGEERVIWSPIKLKIWNTEPDWVTNSISPSQALLDRLTEAEAAVSKETERAKAAEGELNTKIEGEITRAQEAEDTLDSKIDDEIATVTRTAQAAAQAAGLAYSHADEVAQHADDNIASEANRAKGEEKKLSDRIDQTETDIGDIEINIGDIQSDIGDIQDNIGNLQGSTVQTATGSNGVTASVSGTELTVQGVTASVDQIGVAYLAKEVDCNSYADDKSGTTPKAVKKAIITDNEALNDIFNATTTHRGTMSVEDKVKFDAFGDASTYSTKTELKAVTDKIPSQATSSNQLADKDFVNSSINNVAAYYITKNAAGDAFATKAELTAATTYYSGGATRTPTRNDYAIVLADESKKDTVTGASPTTRYLYNNGWEFQYIVNNSSFTAAQWSALNSGATTTNIGQINTNKNDIAAIKTKNTTQDTDISDLKTRMTAVEDKNDEQDTAIDTAQSTADSANTAIATEKSRAEKAEKANADAITALQTRATNIESKNMSQDTAISKAQSAAEAAQTAANGKYSKPTGGITKTDLASAVQTSLGKADSAVQHSDLADVATSGSYKDLINTPWVPTSEEFSLLSGKVTSAQEDIESTKEVVNTLGTDLSDLQDALEAEESRAFGAETQLQTNINAVKKTAEAAIPATQKGANGGVATLGTDGKIPENQLPSYVDDVVEYENRATFPTTGESGKIYVAIDTNLTYRWSGTAYVQISSSLALGETSSTAYAGNKGKQNADDIAALKTKNTSQDEAITAIESRVNTTVSAVTALTNSAVRYTSQTLTDAQKTQVYDNLGLGLLARRSWIDDTVIQDGDISASKIKGLSSFATANRITSSDIEDGTIVNDDISDTAAIEQRKIANLSVDLAAKATRTELTAVKTTADNAMPKAGGQFTGRVSWNETSLPAQTVSPYFVTIEAFAEGGKTYYTAQANVKTNLGITALETSVAGKYAKPSSGIPAKDLAGSIPKTKLDSSVQISLGKADNAVLYTSQTLTDTQKSQARTNLGLGSLATKSTITSSDITNGTIVNEDISTSAKIAQSKIDGLEASLSAKAPLTGYNSLSTAVGALTTRVAKLEEGGTGGGVNEISYVEESGNAVTDIGITSKLDGSGMSLTVTKGETFLTSSALNSRLSPIKTRLETAEARIESLDVEVKDAMLKSGGTFTGDVVFEKSVTYNTIDFKTPEKEDIRIGYFPNRESGARDCVFIGNNLTIDYTAWGSLAANAAGDVIIGNNCTIHQYGTVPSVVIGKSNTTEGIGNTLIGVNNIADNLATSNVVIGRYNHVYGTENFVLGYNIQLTSDHVGYSVYLGNEQTQHLYCHAGSITALSDPKTKEEIEPANLEICYNNLKNIPVHRYKYKDFAKPHAYDVHRVGFLTSEVKKAFPKSVITQNSYFNEIDENGDIVYEEKTDEQGNVTQVPKKFLMNDVEFLDDGFAVPTLWGAVQYMAQKIETLEQKIAELEKNNSEELT